MAGVEFIVFEGDSIDLRPWISTLEDQFARDDYSDLNKLALAVYLIGGEAESYVQDRHELKYFETWDDLKSSLILRFGDRDDPERIRLEAERDTPFLNGRDTVTIKSTDAIQEMKEHIVNLEPNEMYQEESELNATKTDVNQEMGVVCSIQEKLLLEEINSVLETDDVHPREAIPKSEVLLAKNIECVDVSWLFSSRNLMDSVMIRDEFSKRLSDMEIRGNAHQMYDRKSLRAKSSKKHRKQLKCWKFKFKRKKLSGTRLKIAQHKLVNPVPSLSQKECGRLRGLAEGFQKRYVGQDEVINAVVEEILRSRAGRGRLQLIISLKGCSKEKQLMCQKNWMFKYKHTHSLRPVTLMVKSRKIKFTTTQHVSDFRTLVKNNGWLYMVHLLSRRKKNRSLLNGKEVLAGYKDNISYKDTWEHDNGRSCDLSGVCVAISIWDCSTETIKATCYLHQIQQRRVLTLWNSLFMLLVDDVAGILEKLLDKSTCIQWGLICSLSSNECVLLRFVSGGMSDDMLQNLCTEMWLIVTARWSYYQRLMAFYEAIQSSWFPGNFWKFNGTDSFSIWNQWKNKPAIALCGEQEEDKREYLNGNLPSGFDCSTCVVYMQKRLAFLENKACESTTGYFGNDFHYFLISHVFHLQRPPEPVFKEYNDFGSTHRFWKSATSTSEPFTTESLLELYVEQEKGIEADCDEEGKRIMPEAVKSVAKDEVIINMLIGTRIKAESEALLNHGSVLFKKRKLSKSWQFKYKL